MLKYILLVYYYRCIDMKAAYFLFFETHGEADFFKILYMLACLIVNTASYFVNNATYFQENVIFG